MRYILLTLIFLVFISSCKEKKESIVSENNVETKTTELPKTENQSTLIDTTYLNYKNGYEFSRDEILKTVNFYKENYGKETTSFDFVDYDLDPKLYVLAKMVCDNKDEELLTAFLEMVMASTGSASETPSDIFAEIYFCNPSLMLNYLTNKYTDDYLKGQLEFGFGNNTYGSENKIENYVELKAKIDNLIK